MKSPGVFRRYYIVIAGGVILLASALLLLAVVSKYRAAQADDLMQALAIYDKARAIAAYGDQRPQPEAQGRQPFDNQFLPAGPPAVVSANLQTLIKERAAARGIEVSRANDLPVRDSGSLKIIGAGFSLAGPLPTIYGLLQDVETASPALSVERLDIHANPMDSAQTETVAMVEIEVSGAQRSDVAPIGSAP